MYGSAWLHSVCVAHEQVAEAVACMPSVFVLDGVDVLCPSAAGAPDAAAGGAHNVHVLATRVAQYLDELRDPKRPPLPGMLLPRVEKPGRVMSHTACVVRNPLRNASAAIS